MSLAGFCFPVLFLAVVINLTNLGFVGSQGTFLLQFAIIFFGQYFSGICSFDLQRLVGVECWCKTSTQLLVMANWDINIPLEFPLLLGICSGMIHVLHAQSPLYSYFSVHFLSFIILKIPLLCTSHSPNSENPVFVFVCF